MPIIKMNDNWELEENLVEYLYATIYRYGSDKEAYVNNYFEDAEQARDDFEGMCNHFFEISASPLTKIYLVKVANNDFMLDLLERANYFGEVSNQDNIDATMEILNNCEILAEWQGEYEDDLDEAKKKKKKRKKRRKTPKVTYMTGWPWYNDKMFNRHNGTEDEDAGEDAADNANDAIGGGESVGDAGSAGGDFGGDAGDFGGGDGGGMGESLKLKEAIKDYNFVAWVEKGDFGIYRMSKAATAEEAEKEISATLGYGWDIYNVREITPEEKEADKLLENLTEAVNYYDQVPKMKALNDGTRGFNARAASDEKLKVNRQVCIDNSYLRALKIVEDEMRARGILVDKVLLPKISSDDLKEIYEKLFKAVLVTNSNGFFTNYLDTLLKPTNLALKEGLICFIIAISLKQNIAAQEIKDWLVANKVEVAQLKDATNKVLSDITLMKTLQELIKDYKGA